MSLVSAEILRLCKDRGITSISELLSHCNKMTLYELKKTLCGNNNPVESLVFTDGNCKNNGKRGAKAGYSVYWEDSELDTKFSTTQLLQSTEVSNNKAELTAILTVFKIIFENLDIFQRKNIVICADSMYSINCVNTWSKNWIKNGWKNAKNEPVKNMEIIQEIVDLKDKIRVDSRQIGISFKYVPSHGKEPSDSDSMEYRLWKGNKYVDDEINKLIQNSGSE